jgi:hypothetical protein
VREYKLMLRTNRPVWWAVAALAAVLCLAVVLWLRVRPLRGHRPCFDPPDPEDLIAVVYVSVDSGGSTLRLQPGPDRETIRRILDAIRNPTSVLPGAVPGGLGAFLEFRLKDGSVEVLALSPDAQRREVLLLDGSLRMSRELWDIYLELEERVDRATTGSE